MPLPVPILYTVLYTILLLLLLLLSYTTTTTTILYTIYYILLLPPVPVVVDIVVVVAIGEQPDAAQVRREVTLRCAAVQHLHHIVGLIGVCHIEEEG
jgi:hypothetical protein